MINQNRKNIGLSFNVEIQFQTCNVTDLFFILPCFIRSGNINNRTCWFFFILFLCSTSSAFTPTNYNNWLLTNNKIKQYEKEYTGRKKSSKLFSTYHFFTTVSELTPLEIIILLISNKSFGK